MRGEGGGRVDDKGGVGGGGQAEVGLTDPAVEAAVEVFEMDVEGVGGGGGGGEGGVGRWGGGGAFVDDLGEPPVVGGEGTETGGADVEGEEGEGRWGEEVGWGDGGWLWWREEFHGLRETAGGRHGRGGMRPVVAAVTGRAPLH